MNSATKLSANPPEIVRAIIQSDAKKHWEPLTRGQKGAVTGAINKVVDGDANRYLVLAYLFDAQGMAVSSKNLTDDDWGALYEWCGFREDDDGWHHSEIFEVECLRIYLAAYHDEQEHNAEIDSMLGIDKPYDKDIHDLYFHDPDDLSSHPHFDRLGDS